MSPRTTRTALAASVAAATAFGAVALAPTASMGATASYSVAYSCTSSLGGEPFALPMDVTVRASRTGGVTTLEVPGSSPVLSDTETYKDVRITTTLDATADGAPVQLKADKVVTVLPKQPVELPALVGTTSRSSGSTVEFVPGRFVLVVKISIITATQTCTLTGPAPRVSVPLTDPATPVPTATPSPTGTPGPGPTSSPTTTPTVTPKPTATLPPIPTDQSPLVKVRLTKKTQRVGRKPATVVVTVTRPRGAAQPRGTATVTVGKRTVKTLRVTRPTTLRVALPKNLKPGKHTVKVKITWKDGVAMVRTSTRKATVRVKR